RRSTDLWESRQDEYLTSLQKRGKWNTETPNIKIGDLVLIVDDQTQPLEWKLGRVKTTHPGKDGLTRVTTLEVSGTYKNDKGKTKKVTKEVIRPITKIAPLPIYDGESYSSTDSDQPDRE
ncbi:unnamed protein product, partial [Allacma fusca]